MFSPIARRCSSGLASSSRRALSTSTPLRTIREAGGAFAKRESTMEEKYAYEKEKEVIKKLQEELRKRELAVASKLLETPALDPPVAEEFTNTGRLNLHAAAVGTGAIGKRGAVFEEKYIHDKELEDAKKH
ncbi:hypothetical protein BDK51DRAFT_31381 [Blyttiomyces helicus]|uniref:ATPase inhibitor, mitochondrial n=1 Tax=Blyttiomyces helicus TaxID=388810 RepID=A0A4V1IRJ5_9FUNG|nr:hypothetical protein BDK51DRAFT_31381 [Blyttiomyces helicus]|eukprot:RKO90277.1 hypothetical protein BDK51DRAFT_31381 [Blyttiomyces helicus]